MHRPGPFYPRQFMIKAFIRSRLGQIILISFAVASVAAGVMVWVYESIRIPTLNERISMRDDKIKALEGDVQKEGLTSLKWKTVLEQCTNEIAQLTAKLQQSHEDYARLVERQALSALYAATNSNPLVKSNELGQPFGINLEQAVFSVGDQEDLSFFMIEKIISELKSISDRQYASEMADFIVKDATVKTTNQAVIVKMFMSFGLKIGQWFGFRLNLEELRAFMTKSILTHYRDELAKADRNSPGIFYSRIREKPEILASLAELGTTLQATDNPVGWNSNASSLVLTFMRTNQVTSPSRPKNQ